MGARRVRRVIAFREASVATREQRGTGWYYPRRKELRDWVGRKYPNSKFADQEAKALEIRQQLPTAEDRFWELVHGG